MDETTGWSHEKRWPSQTRHVADARSFVTQCLGAYGLLSYIEVVALVVSELATNAVLHADTPFTVTLARRDGALVLEVQDHNRGAIPTFSSVHTEGPHGRGLHIVQALSTSWGVWGRRDGKSVWASFSLGPDGGSRPDGDDSGGGQESWVQGK